MSEKEKMIEVIKQASEQAYADFHDLFREGVKRVRDGEISRFTNRDVRPTHDEIVADALIAAGIGDVKETEHRAEVTGRAFSKLVHEMYEHGIRPMCDEKFFVESRLKDAEKELAEEKKDDTE